MILNIHCLVTFYMLFESLKSSKCLLWYQLSPLSTSYGISSLPYFSLKPVLNMSYPVPSNKGQDSKNICLRNLKLRVLPHLVNISQCSDDWFIPHSTLNNTLTSWQTLGLHPRNRKSVSNANQSPLRCTWHHLQAYTYFNKVTYSWSVLLLCILQINCYPKITWEL